MTRYRAWTVRAVIALAVLAPVLSWPAGPAGASFLSGTRGSATYSTAVLAAPSGLGASVAAGTVTLTWNPSASPPSEGTVVLRAASSAGPYTRIATVAGTAATLTDRPGPGSWYYEAESYCAGWTSAPAGPAAVAVPAVPTHRGQVASGSSVSGLVALTVLTTTAVPAGDLLTVRTAIGSSEQVTSITDAAGDTFVRQAAVSEQKAVTVELWTAQVASPLAAGSPIVVTWSGISGARQAVMVDDFSAAGTTVDGTATGSGRSSAPSATTASRPGDLVVAVTAAGASSAGAYTEAAGWTELGSIGLAAPGKKALSLYGGWRLAAATTTGHAPTLSASTDWAEADVALQPG